MDAMLLTGVVPVDNRSQCAGNPCIWLYTTPVDNSGRTKFPQFAKL